MEFINNIQNFFHHIYTDICHYIGGLLHSPGAMTGLVGILVVVAGFIILNEKVG